MCLQVASDHGGRSFRRQGSWCAGTWLPRATTCCRSRKVTWALSPGDARAWRLRFGTADDRGPSLELRPTSVPWPLSPPRILGIVIRVPRPNWLFPPLTPEIGLKVRPSTRRVHGARCAWGFGAGGPVAGQDLALSRVAGSSAECVDIKPGACHLQFGGGTWRIAARQWLVGHDTVRVSTRNRVSPTSQRRTLSGLGVQHSATGAVTASCWSSIEGRWPRNRTNTVGALEEAYYTGAGRARRRRRSRRTPNGKCRLLHANT